MKKKGFSKIPNLHLSTKRNNRQRKSRKLPSLLIKGKNSKQNLMIY